MSDPSHDRGSFTHPEDGKVHIHPSSLESAHHVGPDGQVVYSPAQKAALARLEAMSEPLRSDELPAFASYVAPGHEAPADAVDAHSASPSQDEVQLDAPAESPPDPAA